MRAEASLSTRLGSRLIVGGKPETQNLISECLSIVCFISLHRALRNEHRKKLLLLTSEKSLEGKLLQNLPELPLKTTRMFSTKALKKQTQKTVMNLTEVQQKKNLENLKNLKRKNRLMTEIFNKVKVEDFYRQV